MEHFFSKAQTNNICTFNFTYFEDKVNRLVDSAVISPNVYNGKKKLAATDVNFMSPIEILECVKQLKIKNCEGYDRIPQRFLIDGIDILIRPLS